MIQRIDINIFLNKSNSFENFHNFFLYISGRPEKSKFMFSFIKQWFLFSSEYLSKRQISNPVDIIKVINISHFLLLHFKGPVQNKMILQNHFLVFNLISNALSKIDLITFFHTFTVSLPSFNWTFLIFLEKTSGSIKRHCFVGSLLGVAHHPYPQQLRLVHVARRVALLHECRTWIQHQRGFFHKIVKKSGWKFT